MSEDSSVSDDTTNHRFLHVEDGLEAQLVYRSEDRRLVLDHTEVPEQLGGRGLGGTLVAAAVARARRTGETLVPVCPFARRWLQKHAGEVADVSIDWAEPAG